MRKLKKITAMLLSLSVMAGIIGSGVLRKETGATSHTFNIQNTLAPGAAFNSQTRDMMANDVVTFDFTVTRPSATAAPIEVGIFRNGAFVQRERFNITSPILTVPIEFTMRVNQNGTYSVRILNNSTVSITVRGDSRHHFGMVNHNTRITYDLTASIFGEDLMIGHFNTAVNEKMRNHLRINFIRTTIFQDSALFGGNCAPNCGAHGSGVAHARATDLLHVGGVSNQHTLRYVGRRLCVPGTQVGGMAEAPGRNSLVTLVPFMNFPAAGIVQHELMHNIGAPDHGGSFPCIMNNHNMRLDTWCELCTNAIFQHRR
jgi:hypothetical protein